MNALPRYNYPPQPPEPIRRQRVRRRIRRHPHQAVAVENGFKLGVNCLLSIVALSALVKLVPYNLAQQAKLQEIRAEVLEVEGRVDLLQADLNRQFDPQQAMSVMQEESTRVDPRQRQIVWLAPPNATAQVPSEDLSEQPRSANSRNPQPYEPAFYPPTSPDQLR